MPPDVCRYRCRPLYASTAVEQDWLGQIVERLQGCLTNFAFLHFYDRLRTFTVGRIFPRQMADFETRLVVGKKVGRSEFKVLVEPDLGRAHQTDDALNAVHRNHFGPIVDVWRCFGSKVPHAAAKKPVIPQRSMRAGEFIGNNPDEQLRLVAA